MKPLSEKNNVSSDCVSCQQTRFRLALKKKESSVKVIKNAAAAESLMRCKDRPQLSLVKKRNDGADV